MKENLLEAISELAREKGIERDEVTKIVEETIAAAARKKLNKYKTIEAEVNPKTGQVELFYYRLVTENLQDPENEILLEDAQAMDPDAEEGDEVEYEIDTKEFNRIAQSARQLIFKRIRDAERAMIFDTFNERKGEILTGTVIRTEQGGRIAINFNKTEAYLFKREQIQGERFEHGEHIRVLLMDVSNDPKQPSQLVLSRTHPDFLVKLFEMEVPEVYDGLVEIIKASREPGKRAKVAVYTSDSDVDPVGACVGMRGTRVQAIVSELRGEKIDIIRWDEELPIYVENAMAPAEIERIEIDEDERQINILVERDQLSLAIGRQGQNVRLASKLIGYKINASSPEESSNLSIDSQIALEMEKSQKSKGLFEEDKGKLEESVADTTEKNAEGSQSIDGESIQELNDSKVDEAKEENTEKSQDKIANSGQENEENKLDESKTEKDSLPGSEESSDQDIKNVTEVSEDIEELLSTESSSKKETSE